jgi:hypothetical protein
MSASRPSLMPGRNLMTVTAAIRAANAVLPGRAAPDGQIDPRWQAIIAVGEFVDNDPEPVWRFVRRWGCHRDEDLRTAIATCLLEHLLEYHFALLLPRVKRLARTNRRFTDTLSRCWQFGEATRPRNVPSLESVINEHKRPRRRG